SGNGHTSRHEDTKPRRKPCECILRAFVVSPRLRVCTSVIAFRCLRDGRGSKRAASPVSGAIAITMLGVALVTAALAANQSWLDRHFLPSFLLPRVWYVRIETIVRVLI